MKRKYIILLWSVLFFSAAWLLISYLKNEAFQKKSLPSAQNGIFDFADLDFNQLKYIKLHGDVFFYWDTLLTPEDFTGTNDQVPTEFIKIPGNWNDANENGQNFSPNGYGTYRFKIKVPDNNPYGLKIKEFETAYSIWINGKHMGGAGKVETKKHDMVPSWKRQEYYFTPRDSVVDVVLQISNFYHRKGGASEIILFGLAKNIRDYKHVLVLMDMFLFGILFILFIYHLVLFFYRNTDKSIVYFSWLCFFMLMRLGTTSEKILLDIFPFLPWKVAVRIEYISVMAIPPFMTLFISTFFPKEIPKWFVKGVNYVCLVFIFIILTTPPSFFTYTPLYFQYIILFAALFLLIKTFVALIKKKGFAVPIFSGFIVFFIFFINDILYYNKTLESSFLLPLGLLILIISQAFALSKKTSLAYIQVEKLSERLENYAHQLEDKVKERTKQILNHKEEIELQKGELEYKAQELEKMNNELHSLVKFKTTLTHMMVHDLKSPLNNIIGFSHLKMASEKHMEIIHSTGWGMLNIIGNILDVEKYKSTEIQLNLHECNLNKVANNAYDHTRYMIHTNQIMFENNIPDHAFVRIDKDIIERVFANIFSNATKYSNTEGVIRVSSEVIENELVCYQKVFIYNSGEAIPANKIDDIFNKYEQVYSQKGPYSYSTGIGLTYCKMMVEAHGGEIGVFSGEERGVTFWFTLPLN